MGDEDGELDEQILQQDVTSGADLDARLKLGGATLGKGGHIITTDEKTTFNSGMCGVCEYRTTITRLTPQREVQERYEDVVGQAVGTTNHS